MMAALSANGELFAPRIRPVLAGGSRAVRWGHGYSGGGGWFAADEPVVRGFATEPHTDDDRRPERDGSGQSQQNRLDGMGIDGHGAYSYGQLSGQFGGLEVCARLNVSVVAGRR
jgi:hypothetical protein